MPKKLQKEKRIRNFTFLVYDDSALLDWKDRMYELAMPGFCAYHDKDLDEDGNLKKSHYHLLFLLKALHSHKQITEVVNYIGGANGTYKDVVNPRSYARYLCHLDDPDKYRYPLEDVICLGGLNYCRYIITESDKVASVEEMMEFCDEKEMYSYADLMSYSKEHNKMWFNVLCSYYGRTVREYIKSRYWEKELHTGKRYKY